MVAFMCTAPFAFAQLSKKDQNSVDAIAKELNISQEKATTVLLYLQAGQPVTMNGKTLTPDFLKGGSNQTEQEVETIPFQMVEQKPSFNGGDVNDFVKWIKEQVSNSSLEGRLMLSLVVKYDGSVKRVQVIRGIDTEFDEQVKKIASSSPKWNPGRQNGNPVNVEFSMLPIVFSLPGIEKEIEDPVFRSYCLSNFDTNKDGQISKEEAANVKKIEVPRKGIHSLKGIEYFTNITSLDCKGNQLTRLDVSKNMALTSLSCWDNQLTHLDISNNPELRWLYCEDNKLTHLDVSNSPDLFYLNCENNQLTNLDVSKNTKLSEIKCDGNRLTNLNVGKNTDVVSSRTASDDAAEEREVITFSTPMDVFNFLQSRVFKSSDGITLDISPYSVKANGRAITGAVQVTYIQRQQAIMKATSPATGHTYTFIAYADKNCIVCDDDHTMYFGKK